MKKTMIYLSEETHEGLRKLAFEHRVSIAQLVRLAVDAVYGEDIEDIAIMDQEIADYEANPEGSLDLETYLKEREAKLRQAKSRVHS